RSDNVLTVAQRGYDDTPAQSWPQGALIRHTISARAMQEASDHINDSSLHMTEADHAAIVHTQAMLGADSVGATQLANNAVDTAALQDLAVTAAKLAAQAVVAGKIAPGAIDSLDLFSSTVLAGLSPTGAVIPFAGSSAPAGWLLCDGSAVLRSEYPDLFAVVGTTYGAGDGSTTFNLPDLRQRFPLGKANTGTGSQLGETGGSIDHRHGLENPNSAARLWWGASSGPVRMVRRTSGVGPWSANVATTQNMSALIADSTGGINGGVALIGDTESANPPYLALNFIIKT